ncbi:MAG: hypothetical protein ACOYNI_06835 [Acidimicrobiia bacterium]
MTNQTFTDTCPRCGRAAEFQFWGPCATCFDELHARFDGAKRDVQAAEYEPKMNVTVNAVALKDD